MEFKEIIIAGVIIIVAAFIISFIFTPASGSHDTNIQILNNGDFGSNSTIYIKLTNNEKTSLSERTVHVQLKDKNGTVVYKKDVKTHATGVAMAQLNDVSPGNYTLDVKFDGDSNYTASSVSKQVTVSGSVVRDTIDNSTLDAATIQDIATSQSQSSTSYTPSSDSSSSSSSSSDSSSSSSDDDLPTYDENGNEYLPIYDENGKEVESDEDS